MKKVAAEGGFKIDIVTYADAMIDRDYVKANVSSEYSSRMRVVVPN